MYDDDSYKKLLLGIVVIRLHGINYIKKELFEDLNIPLGVWSEDYAVTSKNF